MRSTEASPGSDDHFALLPLFRLKTKTNVKIGRHYDMTTFFLVFFFSIFTWVCEPKESSVNLIKKYIAEHHTKLNVDKLSKAIEAGIKKGQLERITGQGRV